MTVPFTQIEIRMWELMSFLTFRSFSPSSMQLQNIASEVETVPIDCKYMMPPNPLGIVRWKSLDKIDFYYHGHYLSASMSVFNYFVMRFMQAHKSATRKELYHTKLPRPLRNIVEQYARYCIFDWIDLFFVFIHNNKDFDLETAMRIWKIPNPYNH